MSELTLLLVGTVAILDEFFTELAFLFMTWLVVETLAWRLFGGKGVTVFVVVGVGWTVGSDD